MIETIIKFESITGYPLKEYFEDYISFVEDKQGQIIDWFSGNTEVPDAGAFDELNRLLKESIKLLEVVNLNRDIFETADNWQILESIEDIDIKLKTINNSSKFLRSAITSTKFEPNPEVDYILKQNQTLENVSTILGSDDKDKDWNDIALRNDLREEGYTPDGGNKLRVTLQGGNVTILRDVIDNIQGDRILGLDINKTLTFKDNDLEVLGFEDTFKQAAEILANLRKEDNPEFPSNGISTRFIVGTNIINVVFPLLFRQLFETFSHDDTIRSF